MKKKSFLSLLFLGVANLATSKETKYPPALVSFQDFKKLVSEVEKHRASRLINFDTFLKMSKNPNTIVLDSRSTFRFDRLHIKGAKHLSFTDFTQEKLAEVIPSFNTTILIYCNNNFEGNQVDFPSKIANPNVQGLNSSDSPDPVIGAQIVNQVKPIMMALNVPTYINLYGYGYRNVYELDELVNVNDARVLFEGSLVKRE